MITIFTCIKFYEGRWKHRLALLVGYFAGQESEGRGRVALNNEKQIELGSVKMNYI